MKKYKAVIVGGGSTWTPGLLKSLCERQADFPLEELRMYDIDAERQAVIGEFAKVLFAEEYPELKFLYTTDKAQAYKDVDFVFCQIRSGGFDMRMLDEQIPLAHGVVGQETCGAGGFAYGLRSIPDMIQIVRDAREYARRPVDPELYQPGGHRGGGAGAGVPGGQEDRQHVRSAGEPA